MRYETAPAMRPCFLDIKFSYGKMKDYNDHNNIFITTRPLYFKKKTKKISPFKRRAKEASTEQGLESRLPNPLLQSFSLKVQGTGTRKCPQHRILLTSWSKYIIKFKTLKVRLQQEPNRSLLRITQAKGSLFVVGVSELVKIICLSKI
jgi:hypothetical protein